jgi:DNA-binding MarR family transcriptional regulator
MGSEEGSVIVRVVLALYRELERASRTAEMTTAQYRVLYFLLRGPKRAAELAADALVQRPSVTPVIVSLVERGWARREDDPTDQRATSIHITPSGEAALNAYELHLERALKQLVGNTAIDEAAQQLAPLHATWSRAREARLLAKLTRKATEHAKEDGNGKKRGSHDDR